MTTSENNTETLVLTEEMRSAASAAPQNKRPAPFSLRLSFEERAQLEEAAAGMPLGTFIREKLLGGDLTPRRTRGRNPVKDHAALAKVLGALGQSRLSSNLNQLAKAAHVGALPVTPEIEEQLTQACAEIRGLRSELMKALGYAAREEDA